VEVEPVEPLATPVTLERIRADAALKDFQLVTRGRLSVVPVTPTQYARVLTLSRRREAPSPALARKRSTARRSPTRRKRAR
jgi:predicted RNA-binding protein with PUA-like domain